MEYGDFFAFSKAISEKKEAAAPTVTLPSTGWNECENALHTLAARTGLFPPKSIIHHLLYARADVVFVKPGVFPGRVDAVAQKHIQQTVLRIHPGKCSGKT